MNTTVWQPNYSRLVKSLIIAFAALLILGYECNAAPAIAPATQVQGAHTTANPPQSAEEMPATKLSAATSTSTSLSAATSTPVSLSAATSTAAKIKPKAAEQVAKQPVDQKTKKTSATNLSPPTTTAPTIKTKTAELMAKQPLDQAADKVSAANLSTATINAPVGKPNETASKTRILAKLANAKTSMSKDELASIVLDQKFQPLPELVKAAGNSYHGDLDEIRKRKVLRVLVTYSRLDFFFDNGQIHGIQAGFFREFENQLNIGIEDPAQRIRVIFLPVTFDQLIPSLTAGLGDVAAAFLSDTPDRTLKVEFAAEDFIPIKEIVVSHASAGKIEHLSDLAGKSIYVLRNSSYKEHLETLNQVLTDHDLFPINIVETDASLHSDDILELVNAGILPITVVDQYRAELWAKTMPSLIIHDEVRIRKARKAGWAIRQNSPQLKAALNQFIENQGKGKLLGNMLIGEYVSNPRWIKNPTAKSERDRLNKYLSLFRKYGEKYGIDELEIAALAYQESGLNHDRQSPRGAVGIMQVMPATATDKNVNIPDINTLEKNVHAGTKYLAFLRDRYYADPGLSESNRQAFIWASYNAGPAKVKNMRELTRQMGLNPDIWFRNVELAAGRLVGRETVDYVANIQKFYIAYQLADELQERKLQAIKTASTPSGASM